ncbi:hypothetical protein F443_03303, partial [Phytophthora nicotianae P1569]
MPMANLTDDERRLILDELLKQNVGGELPRGVQARVGREFRCFNASIGRMWQRFCETEAKDGLGEWKSRIKKNSGRKKKNRDEIAVKSWAVPIEERKPFRPSDPEVLAAGTTDGLNIRLSYQPANRPDTNALDLGLFASLQALQLQQPVYGILKSVEDAYKAMDKDTLDDIFLTLQKCIECILMVGGSNDYKLLHMGKSKLGKEGKLPKSFVCDRDDYTSALAILEKA